MVTGHMPDEEHAALREENARLHDHDFWVKEAHRYREEANHLRAQVAALVQAGHEMLAALRVPGPMPATIEGKQALMERGFDQIDAAAERFHILLDAPDLAALVAREQKREAVIAAARAYYTGEKGGVWDLRDALAALDAVEK